MTRSRSVIAVGVGAVAGATLRWAVGESFDDPAGWPWATFIVNIAGAFLLAIALTATHHRVDEDTDDPIRLAFGTGFCGALTTFSSFAVQIASFARGERVGLGAAYLIVSTMVGVAAFLAGRALTPRSGAA